MERLAGMIATPQGRFTCTTRIAGPQRPTLVVHEAGPAARPNAGSVGAIVCIIAQHVDCWRPAGPPQRCFPANPAGAHRYATIERSVQVQSSHSSAVRTVTMSHVGSATDVVKADPVHCSSISTAATAVFHVSRELPWHLNCQRTWNWNQAFRIFGNSRV